MQLNLDLNLDTMSDKQRESVAQFIINYPKADSVTYQFSNDIDTSKVQANLSPKSQESVRSFADVVQSETVREDTQVTTSTQAPSAPSPPAPSVPSGASTAAPLTGSPVDVDKDGLPWDVRIHSSTRSKIADGSWKLKRGVTPAEVAAVKGELKSIVTPGAPLPPPAPAAKSHYLADQPGFEQPDPKKLFVQLVGRSSEAIKAGRITQAEINACCNAQGIPALPLLATRLELVAQVAADIDAIIASRP